MTYTNQSYSYGVMLAGSVLIGLYFYWIYLSWAGFYSIINFFILSILFIYTYTILFEFNPLNSNPNILCLGDGVPGVKSSDLREIGGGSYAMEIDIKRKYIKKYPEMIKRMGEGFSGLTLWFNANIRVEIVGNKEDFIPIPEHYKNQEGAWLYLRNLDSTPGFKSSYLQSIIEDKVYDENVIRTKLEQLQSQYAIEMATNDERSTEVITKFVKQLNEANEGRFQVITEKSQKEGR